MRIFGTFAFVAVLAISLPAHATYETIHCPTNVSGNSGNMELNYSGIFKGHSTEGNEIMPDEAEYDLNPIRDPAKDFYLFCRYEDNRVKEIQISSAYAVCTADGSNINCD